MEKVIKIGDKDVNVKANALTPIKFKQMFKKDLLQEFQKINDKNFDFEVLSEAVYCFAVQGGCEMTFEEFVGQFEMNEFIQAIPEVINLWLENTNGVVEPKK